MKKKSYAENIATTVAQMRHKPTRRKLVLKSKLAGYCACARYGTPYKFAICHKSVKQWQKKMRDPEQWRLARKSVRAMNAWVAARNA
ncbi:hypothetical protein [Pseudomonas phage pPA-3099-2aT.2]|uniref:Uncharacterized protein n=1 Tax=Pseudomonas phage pPA-3099-2aT.2 TaxID=3003808 RepID=A0AAF0ARH8_9CAUD|nr:hypothetical protein QE325_gp137 [Pseudomonas phage pPA-3099-2aT.2]WBQ35244.1 hypothetical protein [Pseudomonas phage pPA-3099-2aT.2]